MNTKSYSNQSKIELVKSLSSPCSLLTNFFIFMWTHRTLGLVVFWFNSSPRENASFPSTLDFSIKQNRKCLFYIETFVEYSQLYKLTNITSLDLFFLYIFIVITNRYFIYGDVKDNYHTASFDIK